MKVLFSKKQFRDILVIILVSVLCSASVCFAKNEGNSDSGKKSGGKKSVKEKEVYGQVGSITDDYLVVVYSKDEDNGVEYELLLPIDDGLVLNHKDNIGEIKEGDTVRICFEETTTEKDNKSEIKRKPTLLNFVKSGPGKEKIIHDEESQNEASTLQSD